MNKEHAYKVIKCRMKVKWAWVLPYSERKVEKKKSHEKQWFSGHAHKDSDQTRIYRGRSGQLFPPGVKYHMWQKQPCWDQLCSEECLYLALIPSLLSWFRSASKSTCIARISGRARNTSEVHSPLVVFFLSNSTHLIADKEIKQLFLEAFSQHHGSCNRCK